MSVGDQPREEHHRLVTYGVYIVRNVIGLREAAHRHYGTPTNARPPGDGNVKYPCVINFHGQVGTADSPYFYWFNVERYRARLEEMVGKFDNF
ncbi:hypothetical protein D3C81_483380 [compost metagenome]